MKYGYKKYLFLLVSFTVYFLIRYKIAYELTILSYTFRVFELPFFPWSIYMYHFIFNSIFGVLLGLSYLFNESSKEGVWRVEKARLICLVIPSFLISLIKFVSFYNNTFYMMVEYGKTIIFLNQILFGFSFIYSFYKRPIDVNSK